jgi:hypothetical protein
MIRRFVDQYLPINLQIAQKVKLLNYIVFNGFVKSSRCKAREALEVRRIFSYAAAPQE